MGFRKLLEMTDKAAREEIDDYYIISKSRMDNYIHCLENGAAKIQQLTAENERLSKRDGNAKIILCFPTETDPFGQKELEVVDFGVSDNVYMVKEVSAK